MIEEDIKETATIAEVFRLSAELPFMGFRGVCVAFFDRYAEHQELNEFSELVSTNRGLFGRLFNNFNKAEKWLLDRTDFNPDSQASDSTLRSDR